MNTLPFRPESLLDDADYFDGPIQENNRDISKIDGTIKIPAAKILEHSVSDPDTVNHVNVQIDHLPDWSLPGHPTAQIQIAMDILPVETPLLRGVTIDLGGDDTPRFLTLKAALHRADADLVLKVTDANTGQAATYHMALNRRFPGGTNPQSYQQLRFPLDVPDGAGGPYLLDLQLAMRGYVDDGSSLDPFAFVTDMQVVRGPAQTTPRPDIHMRQIGAHDLCVTSKAKARLWLQFDGHDPRLIRLNAGDTLIAIPADQANGHLRRASIIAQSGQILAMLDLDLAEHATSQHVLQAEARAPRLPHTAPQMRHRYAAMRAQMKRAETGDPPDWAQLTHALQTLEGGHANVTLVPLHFPPVDSPEVSIIIPARDRIERTYACLCALALCPNKTPFEVIVVDDGSSDETRHLEAIVSGIEVLHLDSPQHVIRACNQGATLARGDYLLFLNNDTEVTPGWVDALRAGFDQFDDVGATGARLIGPDGRLMDGGGIVWADGRPGKYLRGGNPYDPRVSYARQTDYLSGAALMVSRAAWDQIGGFSPYLEPMCYEDIDLAFKLRGAGFATYYVPAATVYHRQGSSDQGGSDDMKRHQSRNAPRFRQRWCEVLRHHVPPGTNPDLAKDRGEGARVLFIDETTPRPDMDAGSYAADQEMRLIRSLGHKVSFLPRNMAYLGAYTEALQDHGIEVIHSPFFPDPTAFLTARGGEFDLVYVTRHQVAQQMIPLIRQHAPQARVIFQNADLHFLREFRAARVEQDATLFQQARRTQDQETRVMAQADLILSYNAAEHPLIETATGGRVPVMTCPWVVDLAPDPPGPEHRIGLSFLGGFQHHPNGQAMHWFADHVMPHLAQDWPGLALHIYGSRMGDDIRALAGRAIHPRGRVEDIRAAFDPHRIFIAPLQSGAGIKGKVLAAMAHGIPCILSPIAAEGIGLRHDLDCLIAQNPDEWCHQIDRLMRDDDLWLSLRDAARDYLDQAFGRDQGRNRMAAILHAAMSKAEGVQPG